MTNTNTTNFGGHFLHTPTLNPDVLCSREDHDRPEYLTEKDYKFFEDRPGGFLLLKWLKLSNLVQVGQIRSLQDELQAKPEHIDTVLKRTWDDHQRHSGIHFHLQTEVAINSMDDRIVERRVPTEELAEREPLSKYVFPQTHALQHFDDHAVLYGKYYNGGNIWDMARWFHRNGRVVPEVFIWHFIAQMGRAFSWLHFGQHTNPFEKSFIEGNEDWKPLAHMDAHPANYMLHFPTPEELAAANDPVLAELCSYGLPQIVLADFGEMIQIERDARKDEFKNKMDTAIEFQLFQEYYEGGAFAEDWETWKDRAYFAYMLFLLTGADMGPNGRLTDDKENWDGEIASFPKISDSAVAERLRDKGYSEDLIEVLRQLEYLAPLAYQDQRFILVRKKRSWWKIFEDAAADEERTPWKWWPTFPYFYSEMVQLADRKVAEFKEYAATDKLEEEDLDRIRNHLTRDPGPRPALMPFRVRDPEIRGYDEVLRTLRCSAPDEDEFHEDEEKFALLNMREHVADSTLFDNKSAWIVAAQKRQGYHKVKTHSDKRMFPRRCVLRPYDRKEDKNPDGDYFSVLKVVLGDSRVRKDKKAGRRNVRPGLVKRRRMVPLARDDLSEESETRTPSPPLSPLQRQRSPVQRAPEPPVQEAEPAPRGTSNVAANISGNTVNQPAADRFKSQGSLPDYDSEEDDQATREHRERMENLRKQRARSSRSGSAEKKSPRRSSRLAKRATPY